MGHTFKSKELLIEAITHRSYAGGKKRKPSPHNERLEFLGDSVISLILSERLYEAGLDEAAMSQARSVMVKGAELARVANSVSLGDYLLIGKGEQVSGGRKKQSILAGAFEAVMGALYLDGGYAAARKVLLRFMGDLLEQMLSGEQFHDPKTQLQELCQRRFAKLPSYRLVKEEGREHEKLFTCGVFIERKLYGKGKGKTKKEAEKLAATLALERLKKP